MSFSDCVNTAADAGEISKDNAEWLKRRFEELRQKHADKGSMADEAAKKELAKLLEAETAHKRKKAKLAVKAVKRMDADLRSFRNAKGELDIAQAAIFKLEHFGEAPFESVAGRERAIVGMAHARMSEPLEKFRRGYLLGDKGRWNMPLLENVAREAFGEDTGDVAAKHLAQVWLGTADGMRERFNAAGGAIGKLENWGLPQMHNAEALRNRGLQAWKDDIIPMLAVDKMKHPLTGEPVDPAELDGILSDIYQNIVTEGWADRQPSMMRFGRGALANQRAEHRFLIFKDADTWLRYQREYGRNGDVFGAMMGHVNMMARDIAALEILGPNPDGMIEWMKQAVQKQAQLHQAGVKASFAGNPEKAVNRAKATTKKIDEIWGSIRGALNTPVNATMASVGGVFRSLVTASVMGSAVLSSFSDVGTSMVARRFNGIGGSALKDILAGFTSKNQKEAVEAGLILDSAMHVFHSQARYVGTLDGPGWAAYIPDRVLALSGLTAWTQAGKHAFGMAAMAQSAKEVGKAFGDVTPYFADMLKRHGFTANDWDALGKVKIHDANGLRILRPTEIDKQLGTALAEKYLSMIQKETMFAIPEGGHRSTVVLKKGQPGTLIGEAVRSFAMFKSFGAVFIILHGLRIHNMLVGNQAGKGAAYAASLLISTTLFGALSLQLKSLANGRDPRDMTDREFWGAAMLQGGGLGIYGDFFFANVNRFGGGLATTVAGPIIERTDQLRNLIIGNAVQLASGEKTDFGKELVQFARGNVPGGNIWYLRQAWERIALDSLQYAADPEAAKAFRRRKQFYLKNYNQGTWWNPGEMTPSRKPDFGAVIGGSR